MLGPLASKYFLKGYQWSNYTFQVLHRWDEKTRTIRTSNAPLDTFLFIYCRIGVFVGLAWVGIRTYQASLRENTTPIEQAFYFGTFIVCILTTFPVVIAVDMVIHHDDYPLFHWQYADLAIKYKRAYMCSVMPTKTLLQKIRIDEAGVKMMSLYVLVNALIYVVPPVQLLIPKFPILLTSLYDFPLPLFIPVYCIQIFFIGHYVLGFAANLFLLGFPAVDYLHAMVFWMKEMTLGQDNYETDDAVREPDIFMKNIRQLQVLHSYAMLIYSPIIIPAHKWIFLFLTVYSFYGFIRFGGLLGIMMLMLGTALFLWLVVAFYACAVVYDQSQIMLGSWTARRQSPLVRRFLKSFKPFYINVGPLYIADKGMVLTMFQFVLESVANLLVAA